MEIIAIILFTIVTKTHKKSKVITRMTKNTSEMMMDPVYNVLLL